MELNKNIRKMAERRLCGNKKLRCKKQIEIGENNLIPFQKVSWLCSCEVRKKKTKRLIKIQKCMAY